MDNRFVDVEIITEIVGNLLYTYITALFGSSCQKTVLSVTLRFGSYDHIHHKNMHKYQPEMTILKPKANIIKAKKY